VGLPLRTVSTVIQVDGELYSVQPAQNLGEYYRLLNRFAWLAAWVFPGVLLISSAGGYWLCRRALAPVNEIATSARSISAQNLKLRLPVPQTGDELQILSETLNEMMTRLDTAFERVTQFTADASHELRTPIALIRTASELSLRNPKSLEDCIKTLERIAAFRGTSKHRQHVPGRSKVGKPLANSRDLFHRLGDSERHKSATRIYGQVDSPNVYGPRLTFRRRRTLIPDRATLTPRFSARVACNCRKNALAVSNSQIQCVL